MDKTTKANRLIKSQRIVIALLLLVCTVISIKSYSQEKKSISLLQDAKNLRDVFDAYDEDAVARERIISDLREKRSKDDQLIRRMAEYLPRDDKNYCTFGPSSKEWNGIIQDRLKEQKEPSDELFPL